jgi:hypothetical protein
MAPTTPRGLSCRSAATAAAAALVLVATLGGVSAIGAPAAAAAAANARHAASTGWWVPPLGSQPWQWELSDPLNLKSAHEMGTNDKLPNGSPAPDPVIYDIDAIINSAKIVTALHNMGKHVVCYIEVGAAGNYYTAANEGIPTTYYEQFEEAGVLGPKVSGWPERYLNIDAPATLAIVEAMISQQCAAKGFDAVETDIDEEYASSNGFGLTQADEVSYMTTLATYMHGLGLGWWIKNPDDTGDDYATIMEPLADAVLTEQCNQYSTCGALSAYVGQKAVFNAEYSLKPAKFCAKDDALGFNGAQFNVNLTGVRRPCQ